MGPSRIWNLTLPGPSCQPPRHPFAFPAALRPTRGRRRVPVRGQAVKPCPPAQGHLDGTSRQPGGETTALPKEGLSKSIPGDDLLSHTLARAVPSALRGLTAVFGMGTGVSPSPESPENLNFKRTEDLFEIFAKLIGKLNRVRSDGIRRDKSPAQVRKTNQLVKPNDRLVQVSSMPCGTYTSCLSTW